MVLSSPLPPLCRSPFESELFSVTSLWRPVVSMAPEFIAGDLPLLLPLSALVVLALAFESAPALARALALALLLLCVSVDELLALVVAAGCALL